MKLIITYKGFEKQDKKELQRVMTDKVTALETKLGSLNTDGNLIQGTLERHDKLNLIRFGATLRLPKKIISVEEEGEDAKDVINTIFAELERQAQKYKSRLKNQHIWKRKARRKQLKDRVAGTVGNTTVHKQATAQNASNWFDEISGFLDDLYHFSVKELTYLQAMNELAADDIQPDELVDEVVVLAFEKHHEKPEDMDVKAWLYKLMLDVLDRECLQSQRQRQAISLETVIPEEDIDTEMYEFYQPDSVLKLEDLIAVPEGLSETIEQQLIAEQKQLHTSLAQLPRSWRRAMLFQNTIGFSPEQIADIMDLELAEVNDLLKMSKQFIIEHAQQTGLFVNFQVQKAMQSTRRTPYSKALYDELSQKVKG